MSAVQVPGSGLRQNCRAEILVNRNVALAVAPLNGPHCDFVGPTARMKLNLGLLGCLACPACPTGPVRYPSPLVSSLGTLLLTVYHNIYRSSSLPVQDVLHGTTQYVHLFCLGLLSHPNKWVLRSFVPHAVEKLTQGVVPGPESQDRGNPTLESRWPSEQQAQLAFSMRVRE